MLKVPRRRLSLQHVDTINREQKNNAGNGRHVVNEKNAKKMNFEGMPALIFAATEGHAEIVRILLGVPNIAVNVQDNDVTLHLFLANTSQKKKNEL